MYKLLFILYILSVTTIISNAQPQEFPEPSLFLTITRGDGYNGIGVAYNPKTGLYYAAIAGNASFPLECFRGEENIYQDSVGFDARGFWFNEKTGTLEGNCYQGTSIYSIKLDKSGFPEQVEKKYPGAQPDDNASGSYNNSTDEVIYLVGSSVESYKRTSGKQGKTIELEGCPVSFDNINTGVIFTGQKNYEYGIYDFTDAKVYFFNKKGKYTATSDLGMDAPYAERYNFSYTNGYIFLFDVDYKEWLGYKVF